MLNIQDYGSGGGGGVDLPVAVEDGGTGATTAEDARDNLGITSAGVDYMKLAPFTFQATAVGSQGLGISVTATGTALVSPDATSHYVRYTSAATTAARGGWSPSQGCCNLRNTETVYMVFKTGSSLASCRIYAGVGAATSGEMTTLMASDDLGVSTLNAAMLRYSTAVDGTAFWRFVTSDAATQTVTTTAVAIAVSTRYEVKIVPTADDIKCYINDVLAATNTTNLPSMTATLGAPIQIATQENVAKEIYCSRIAIEPTA